MPKNLINLSLAAPGFYGLNRQQSGGILPPGWATLANNLVFDDKGRFSSRKGHQHVNATTTSSPFRAVHEYVDAGGNRITIGASGNKIYKVVGSTLTDITGSIPTPTADNWQFTNFNGTCVGYQAGHHPIELTTTTGTFATPTGTHYNGNMVAAAAGRLWTVFNNTLYYSDLLINNFTAGSSGSFDLAEYWKDGMDEAVAIVEFNGYLAVFGRNNTIIYSNPDDPTASMAIAENIGGIGCIARDSVQTIGHDVLLLSKTGVRSLSRIVQEKSLPIGDVSRNNQDYINEIALVESEANIKSAYHSRDNFYLLSFAGEGVSFYFDMKFPLEDGSRRTTEWDLTATAMASTEDGELLLAVDSGFISKYINYKDGVLSDGSGGSSYIIEFESAWSDGGAPNILKMPKRMAFFIMGGNGRTVVLKWAFDYLDQFSSATYTVPTTTGAEWGIAEYNVDEYSGTLLFNTAKANPTKTGEVIKLGFTTVIDGEIVAVQKVELHAKIGKMTL